MSVPARKKSRSAVRRRRSHHGLKAKNVAMCRNCQAPVMPHRACSGCGSYKGRETLDVSREAVRAVKKDTHQSADSYGHPHEGTSDSKEFGEKASS